MSLFGEYIPSPYPQEYGIPRSRLLMGLLGQYADPRMLGLITQQENSRSALTGELGPIRNDGGISTELSETISHPEINRGLFTNIPMLVSGQDSAAVARILAGNTNEQDRDAAISRAIYRAMSGQMLPGYPSIDDAIAAAILRSAYK